MLRTGRQYTTADGTPTTGVFSYINCLLSIIKSQEPTHVIVAYDAGGNVRKDVNSSYKANRGPLSEDFITENNILKDEGHYAMGLESIGIRGIEADDILYTLSHVAQFGIDRFDEVVIATVDQDLLQCVTERCGVLLWNSTKKQQMMWVSEVREKWGCDPDDIRFIKALSGDSSDNIKGIKGVGPKTAIKIFVECNGDITEILEHPKVKDHSELVMNNLSLVNLRNVIGTIGPIDWSDHELGKGLEADLVDFLTKYECNSLLKRLKSIKETLRVKS